MSFEKYPELKNEIPISVGRIITARTMKASKEMVSIAEINNRNVDTIHHLNIEDFLKAVNIQISYTERERIKRELGKPGEGNQSKNGKLWGFPISEERFVTLSVGGLYSMMFSQTPVVLSLFNKCQIASEVYLRAGDIKYDQHNDVYLVKDHMSYIELNEDEFKYMMRICLQITNGSF